MMQRAGSCYHVGDIDSCLQISHRARQSVLQAVRLWAFLSCSHVAAARLRLGGMQAKVVIGCDEGEGGLR
jgi:hypothetical protein